MGNLISFPVSHVYFFVGGGSKFYSQTGWRGRDRIFPLDPPLSTFYPAVRDFKYTKRWSVVLIGWFLVASVHWVFVQLRGALVGLQRNNRLTECKWPTRISCGSFLSFRTGNVMPDIDLAAQTDCTLQTEIGGYVQSMIANTKRLWVERPMMKEWH